MKFVWSCFIRKLTESSKEIYIGRINAVNIHSILFMCVLSEGLLIMGYTLCKGARRIDLLTVLVDMWNDALQTDWKGNYISAVCRSWAQSYQRNATCGRIEMRVLLVSYHSRSGWIDFVLSLALHFAIISLFRHHTGWMIHCGPFSACWSSADVDASGHSIVFLRGKLSFIIACWMLRATATATAHHTRKNTNQGSKSSYTSSAIFALSYLREGSLRFIL